MSPSLDPVYITWEPQMIGRFLLRGILHAPGRFQPIAGHDNKVIGEFIDPMRTVKDYTVIMPLFLCAVACQIIRVLPIDPDQKHWLLRTTGRDGNLAGLELEYPVHNERSRLQVVPLEFLTDKGEIRKTVSFINGVPALCI